MILDKENVLNKLLKGIQMGYEVLIEGEEHKYSKSALFGFRNATERHLNAPTISKSFKLVSDVLIN